MNEEDLETKIHNYIKDYLTLDLYTKGTTIIVKLYLKDELVTSCSETISIRKNDIEDYY
jgi:hypothetical protein